MAAKKRINIKHRLPVLAFVYIGISVLSSISPALNTLFVLDREAVLAGQWWRLLTCHFVHFSPPHLVYNILAFGIAGCVVEADSRQRFGLLCLLSATVISVWMIATEPDLAYYGGLSGMACCILCYAAIIGLQRNDPWKSISTGIICLLPIKVVFEIFSTTSVLPYGEQQAFVIMPMSHAAGILTAWLFHALILSQQTKGRFNP